jgi:hypothetical protein
MSLAARCGGQLEAVADLDALDRLDAHEGPGQPSVEPPVPVDVGPEAGREPVDHHLHDPAEGVAIPVGLVDPRDHGSTGPRVEASHLVRVHACRVVGTRDHSHRRADAAELDHV